MRVDMVRPGKTPDYVTQSHQAIVKDQGFRALGP
jgi:hypothetical protein